VDIPDDFCAAHRLYYQATDFKIWGPDLDCPSGVCDDIENTCNCSEDCGSETCGNDICCVSEGEDCDSCPEDCGDCPICGDGNIEPSEDCDPPGALCANGELCLDDCTCPGPPNDDCVDHMPIFDGDTDYITIGASTDGRQHVNICAYDGQTYHDIWYDYTAWCTGELTVTTCDQADYDTDLVIYDGCYDDIPCPPTDAHLLGCNDDNYECTGYSSKVRVPVLSDNCYTIRVGGWYEGSMGTGTVTVTCDGGCGDGACLPTEDCCSCPADCCVCGDGTCDPCEDCYACPEECEECVCPAPLVYDNGLWTGVNAGAPTPGWALAGLIDDFVLPDPDLGGDSFTCVQVALFVQSGAAALDNLELRIYDLSDVDGQGGGDGTLSGLGDFNLAVPKCFLTYSVDDGSLIISLLQHFFGGDVKSFDGIGDVCDLSAGHYGFHIMLPGIEDNYFWTTAPPDDSECLTVWGPEEPFPVDFCASGSEVFRNVHFNIRGFQPCEQCPFDSNYDAQVDASDLANLLGAWGECIEDECLCVDANADGQVDAVDLANLLGAWGPCP
jgi:hypothetical protein